MTKFLTTVEAAAALGLSESRVRVLCAAGRLGRKIGRNYLIESADLARFRRKPRSPGRPKSTARK